MTIPPYLKNVTKLFVYGPRPKPARDWFIVIELALLIIIASVLWNVVVFQGAVSGKAPAASTNATTRTVNHKTIQQVQQMFGVRAAQQAKYESGAMTFSDPSK